jgi:hypothetical protein
LYFSGRLSPINSMCPRCSTLMEPSESDIAFPLSFIQEKILLQMGM